MSTVNDLKSNPQRDSENKYYLLPSALVVDTAGGAKWRH
jgi:hypothetical protein